MAVTLLGVQAGFLGSPVGPLCATRVRRLSRCRSQGRGPPRGEKELLRGGSDIPWGLPCTRLNTGCSRLSRAWWASSEGCEGTGSLVCSMVNLSTRIRNWLGVRRLSMTPCCSPRLSSCLRRRSRNTSTCPVTRLVVPSGWPDRTESLVLLSWMNIMLGIGYTFPCRVSFCCACRLAIRSPLTSVKNSGPRLWTPVVRRMTSSSLLLLLMSTTLDTSRPTPSKPGEFLSLTENSTEGRKAVTSE
uniref:Uncharacterized protein n=1 Tax=Ixodes ricinus TaxID=34613 RepID=A0A147BF85_IXORI